MAETYCGRTCAECAERAQLKCPGCKLGPGRPYGGDCSITRCCVTKGLSSCGDCVNASTCFQWKHHTTVSTDRLKNQNRQVAETIARAEENQFLSQWVGVLFWYSIINMVLQFMFGIATMSAELKWAGELVSVAGSIGLALIFLKISQSSHCFRVAGICTIVSVVFTFLGSVLEGTGFGTLFTLVALLPSVVATYFEFVGYSEITEEQDEQLASDWRGVWYANLIGIIGLIVALVLTLLGTLLGALLTIVIGLGLLVVAVVKYVLLYKTAQLFRELSE